MGLARQARKAASAAGPRRGDKCGLLINTQHMWRYAQGKSCEIRPGPADCRAEGDTCFLLESGLRLPPQGQGHGNAGKGVLQNRKQKGPSQWIIRYKCKFVSSTKVPRDPWEYEMDTHITRAELDNVIKKHQEPHIWRFKDFELIDPPMIMPVIRGAQRWVFFSMRDAQPLLMVSRAPAPSDQHMQAIEGGVVDDSDGGAGAGGLQEHIDAAPDVEYVDVGDPGPEDSAGAREKHEERGGGMTWRT
eukprot:9187908-Pyramimonas_sp.AAC.1